MARDLSTPLDGPECPPGVHSMFDFCPGGCATDCPRGGQHLPYSVIARHSMVHIVRDHCVKCGKNLLGEVRIPLG